jgi:hypothetical protein
MFHARTVRISFSYSGGSRIVGRSRVSSQIGRITQVTKLRKISLDLFIGAVEARRFHTAICKEVSEMQGYK